MAPVTVTLKRKNKSKAAAPATAHSSQSTQSSVTIEASSSSSTTGSSDTSSTSTFTDPSGSADLSKTTPTKGKGTAQTEPLSTRQRLAVATSQPKSRKRKRTSTTVEEEEENEAAMFRALDRSTRWNTFLYFTNDLWEDILKGVYGEGLIIDSTQVQQARAKVFDSVKGYKNKVIAHMTSHVRELLAAPEHLRLKMYTTRQLLSSFFQEVFSASSFFFVWYFMAGYVQYDGSSALGQYYMRSIYTNLAIEVKLYLDAEETGLGVLDARNDLLRFYDTIPLHQNFANVDKNDFKELTHRYRNDKKKPKMKSFKMLETHFVSLGAPPPKTTVRDEDKEDSQEEDDVVEQGDDADAEGDDVGDI